LKLRFPLVLLAAVATFAIPAGSAFASHAVFVASGTFSSPTASATISQNQTLTVDTNGVTGAVGVDFYVDNAGAPGMYIGGYSAFTDNPQGYPYSSNGGVDSYQLAVGGWDDGSLTIDAVIVDSTSHQLSLLSRTVTIDNTQHPLVQGPFSPPSIFTQSGTIALSLTPSDHNNTINSGTFSVDGGDTTYPLAPDGFGHWAASVDTVALGVPNGALDIRVHLQDVAGNTSDTDVFYTVGNPQAPVITPGTLVADKSNFRTDETQLEVGDSVQAYGMQASGYPAPVIHYLWNICSGPNGQTCTGVTPGADGSYTVQPGDVGADLTLVATATNGVGRAGFTLVDFGVIAPAYVAPVDNGGSGNPAPTPEPTPAPVVTPPVVTPPVVIPPVVTPPVVTPPVVTAPVVTRAAQKAIDVAQQAVQSKTAAVVTAKKAVEIATQAVKTVQKKVDAAVNTASAGTATPTEKKKLSSTVATLVAVKAVASSKVEAAKAVTAKAVVAQKASAQTVDVAQKSVVAAKTAVATGASTPAEQKSLVKTEKSLVAAKAVASAKTTDVATVTKQLVVTQAAADQSVKVAQTNVTVALIAVASPTATTSSKETLIAVESKLVTAKAVAAVKAGSLQLSSSQLVLANQKLALQKKAALKP
jgi:hypothetical protein